MKEDFIFEKEYSIHVYETGPDSRLSLPGLFDFMQDIASDHAEKLGFGRKDLMKNLSFWALSRMYAEIETLPAWEEKIIVKTWPNGTDRLFALRNYEVRYPDGRLIAYATSSWLILDHETRKIQRPESSLGYFREHFQPMDSAIRYAVKLEQKHNNPLISGNSRVRISDLDINLHTNNVKYLKWITDTYDLDFVMKNIPMSVEINYLSESFYNDEIFIATTAGEKEDCVFNHSVFRKDDDKELCRVRLKWKEKE